MRSLRGSRRLGDVPRRLARRRAHVLVPAILVPVVLMPAACARPVTAAPAAPAHPGPTHASPTHASPTHAGPTHSGRPHASPRNASPTRSSPTNVRPDTGSAGPLHARGASLVDARGRKVTLTGVNWFGLETTNFAPGGLGVRSWQSILDQMVSAGFNTLRLPYANQLFTESSRPNGIDYGRNPDLQGLQGLALMDRIVKGATDRGLMVLLDQHRPDPHGQGDLWYTDQLSEAQWVRDWTMLARHYRDNPRVIGADLRNEPHGRATWGTGDGRTDWRLAAERAGNAVLQANPNWLIVVEGISDGYWWGGTLTGAKKHPVRLSSQDKLLYSAHDYGPGVWQQSWFKAANFPANMPALWRKEWAYLAIDGTAPVLMGEFGGRSVDPGTVEGKWQRELMRFIKEQGISYTYWAWNPESEDTGGIVKDDWTTIDKAKLAMLRKYQAPLLDAPSDRARSATATKLASVGSTYVVRPGDTLGGIARARHVAGGWQALWKLNRGTVHDPDLLRPGLRLRLP